MRLRRPAPPKWKGFYGGMPLSLLGSFKISFHCFIALCIYIYIYIKKPTFPPLSWYFMHECKQLLFNLKILFFLFFSFLLKLFNPFYHLRNSITLILMKIERDYKHWFRICLSGMTRKDWKVRILYIPFVKFYYFQGMIRIWNCFWWILYFIEFL